MQKQLMLKVLSIIILGLTLLIPISMVSSKVSERQNYLDHAKHSVSQSWTGAQRLLTPMLVIPYQQTIQNRNNKAATTVKYRQDIVVPNNMNNRIKVDNKTVYRGIYEVPVYNSQINFSGTISADKIRQKMDKIRAKSNFSHFGTPFISVHISDMRGIDATPALSINTQPVALSPGSNIHNLGGGLHIHIEPFVKNVQDLDIDMSFSLRGMGELNFIQLADSATTSMISDWAHPEFVGASLPKERNISTQGFEANWSGTRYGNNNKGVVSACINGSSCELDTIASGVKFIQPVDIYLQSERSIKYAILFIGLSFITFFIFENIKQIRIHPIQYTFVGLAISIFYLLLISLAEHIAFYLAYLIAVTCCSTLLLVYVRYMLHSLRSAALFSCMVVGLYGLLYVIIQAEDFALLMGALLVFTLLASLMYITRKIDWYNLTSLEPNTPKT